MKTLREIRQLVVRVRKLNEIITAKTINVEGITLNIPSGILTQLESKKQELLTEIQQAIEGKEET